MISLRTLRRKIKSIKSIQQIFHAMKMISSVRLKRSKTAFDFADAYSRDLKGVVADLFYITKNSLGDSDIPPGIKQFVSVSKTEKICLVVITSDKGLCGSFNSNIVRAALEFTKQNASKEIKVISIGKKGKSALSKKLTLLKEFDNTISLKYTDAKKIVGGVLDAYIKEGFTKLYITHAKFKSTLTQPIVTEQFLPVSYEVFGKSEASQIDYLCEPEPEKLFYLSIPMYINSLFFKVLLDSALAEHAARVNAMETAMTNSDDLISDLSLQLNKLRQERITSEISEVTANML